VRDFDRAAQWCARMQVISTRFVFELGMGVCRAHYGGVLLLHGRWGDAEGELVAAGETLARSRPLAVVESDVRLAELRRRQGDLQAAHELFTRSLPHPSAVTGLATMALDRGEPHRAVDALDHLLEAIPPANATERADPLAVLARARAATSDAEGAQRAAAELRTIAASVGTLPLRAMAGAAAAAAASAAGDEAVPPTTPEPLARLSPRERQVIALLAEGLSDRELAHRLHISTHTAHRHVSNILAKLGVHTRAAAAALAARHGVAGGPGA
jgi:DNA-binding CsgD family transcriptional regulator